MEDMAGASLRPLSSSHPARDVLEVVELCWERHPGVWAGLEYFTLALLLTSQAPDSIKFAQLPDLRSLALVLGLH